MAPMLVGSALTSHPAPCIPGSTCKLISSCLRDFIVCLSENVHLSYLFFTLRLGLATTSSQISARHPSLSLRSVCHPLVQTSGKELNLSVYNTAFLTRLWAAHVWSLHLAAGYSAHLGREPGTQWSLGKYSFRIFQSGRMPGWPLRTPNRCNEDMQQVSNHLKTTAPEVAGALHGAVSWFLTGYTLKQTPQGSELETVSEITEQHNFCCLSHPTHNTSLWQLSEKERRNHSMTDRKGNLILWLLGSRLVPRPLSFSLKGST